MKTKMVVKKTTAAAAPAAKKAKAVPLADAPAEAAEPVVEAAPVVAPVVEAAAPVATADHAVRESALPPVVARKARSAKKADVVVPQVPALPGVTPLGVPEATPAAAETWLAPFEPMNASELADGIALAVKDAVGTENNTYERVAAMLEVLVERATPAARSTRTRASRPAGERKIGGKTEMVIGLARRPEGVTAAEIIEATGWKATSVGGFISGTLGSKLGLAVESFKNASGLRTYRIT
jgi:hypothetical protein